MSRKLSVGALALLAGLAVPAAGSAQVSGFSFGVGGLFDGVSFGFGVSAYDGYSDGYYDDGYYGDPYASSAWCSYGPVPPYGYGSGFGYMGGWGPTPYWGPGVLNSGWYNDCILGGSPHAYHAFHAQLLFWQHRNSWRQRWYQAIRVQPLWDPWGPFYGYDPWGPVGYYGPTSVVVVNNNGGARYGWSGQRYASPFYRGTDYKEAARDGGGQSAIPRGRGVASPAPRTGAGAPSDPGDIRRGAPTSMARPDRPTAIGSPAARRDAPTAVPTRPTTRTGSPGASRSAPATVRLRPSDAAREGSGTPGRARPTVTRATPPQRPSTARRPSSLLRGDDRPETRAPDRGAAAPARPSLGVRGSTTAPRRPSTATPTRPTQRTNGPTETRRRPVIRPPSGGTPATAGPTRRPTSGNPVIRRPTTTRPTARPTQRSGGTSKPVIRSKPVKRTGGGGSAVKRPPARSGGGGSATTTRRPTVRKPVGGGA